MSGVEVVRAWTPQGFEAIEAPLGATLAADSWLVDDGLVLAFERHRRRFADAVGEAGGDRHEALVAAEAAGRLVPESGRWSPRLDLTPEGIRLRIRPAPPVTSTAKAVTAARDPRALPLRKGPDLVALAELQAEETARAGTAVEPIITFDGHVAEGTWSALLWWRDAALCVPADDIPRLGSVTAAVVVELARDEGIEVRQERSAPAELAGCEVWLANALRGIRAVTDWIDGPALAPAHRAAAWQARLAAQRTGTPVIRR